MVYSRTEVEAVQCDRRSLHNLRIDLRMGEPKNNKKVVVLIVKWQSEGDRQSCHSVIDDAHGISKLSRSYLRRDRSAAWDVLGCIKVADHREGAPYYGQSPVIADYRLYKYTGKRLRSEGREEEIRRGMVGSTVIVEPTGYKYCTSVAKIGAVSRKSKASA